MLKYDFEYINNILLKQFVSDKNIPNSQKVLCQIFTSICEIEYIKEVTSNLKSILPQINIGHL